MLEIGGSDHASTNFKGAIRKRKCNALAGTSVAISSPEAGQIVIAEGKPIENETRVANAKKMRQEKHKAALLNYKQLAVKPAESYPSPFTRSTPCVLYKAVKEMNDIQHFAVATLGFNHLLELPIKDMPGKLNYWLLDCFNHRRCEIELPSGTKIPITEDDVHRVFGFPKGDKNLIMRKREDTFELYEQWKEFFPSQNSRLVKIHELKDVMLSCVDGGRWFKLHFLLMVAHCLIESTTNGCILPKILPSLEDLKIVDQFNWCEYVIDSLITNKKEWKKNTVKMYVGPALS